MRDRLVRGRRGAIALVGLETERRERPGGEEREAKREGEGIGFPPLVENAFVRLPNSVG